MVVPAKQHGNKGRFKRECCSMLVFVPVFCEIIMFWNRPASSRAESVFLTIENLPQGAPFEPGGVIWGKLHHFSRPVIFSPESAHAMCVIRC